MAAQPVLGEPFDAAPRVYVPIFGGSHREPAIAYSGGQYLVYASNAFARVLPDGTVLDRPVKQLSSGGCTRAQLFPSGTGWQVWCLEEGQRHSVDASGTVSATFDLLAEHGLGDLNDVARNGDLWLAVGATGGAESDVVGALLDEDDELVGGSLITIADAMREQHQPSVVAQGSSFLVAYADDRYADVPSEDLRITSVSASGVVADSDGTVLFDEVMVHEQFPELLAGASGPLLLYHRSGSGISSTYQAQHLDASGAPSGAGRQLGTTSYAAGSGYFDGVDHVVVVRSSATFVYKLNASSELSFVARLEDGEPTAIASDGTGNAMVTFPRNNSGHSGFDAWLAQRLDATGKVGEEIVVVGQTTSHYAQALASNGAGYLALYNEKLLDSAYAAAHAVPLDFQGRPATEPTWLLQPRYEGGGVDVVDADLVGLPNGNYLATYAAHNQRIVRSVLDPLGQPVEEDNSTILMNAHSPRVSASDSSAMLVVNRSSNGVYKQRLSFSGEPLDPSLSFVTTATGSAASRGDVATFEDIHLIVWEDRRNSATTGVDIYGLFVRDDGELISRDALPIVTGAEDQLKPTVTATDDGWLIAWLNEDDTYSVRSIDEAGTLGAISTQSTGDTAYVLMVTAGQEHALVAWMSRGATTDRIDAQLFTLAGAAVGGPIAVITHDQYTPTLAAVASIQREFLVSYSIGDAEAQAFRVFHRRLHLGNAIGMACDDDADCEGTCDDGVCCTSSCGDDVDDCAVCSQAEGALYDGLCTLLPATAVCRAVSGDCDVVERCTGEDPECPANTLVPDGDSCADSNACNGEELCYSGECTSVEPLDCDDENACTTDACDTATGCESTPIDGCADPEPELDAGTTDAATIDPETDASMAIDDAGMSTGGTGASGQGGSGSAGGGDPVGNSGGTGGMRAQAGTGAVSSGGSGGAVSGGSGGDTPSSGSSSGCGCSIVRHSKPPPLLLLGFATLLLLRRRR